MTVIVPATSAIDVVAWEREHEQNEHVGELKPKYPILKYVPSIFRFDHAPIEATGAAFNMFGRTFIFMSSLFLGPALLRLASNHAATESHCIVELGGVDYEECLDDSRVYGFKPSSLLTNISAVGGFLGALFLPPIGAMVDYTPHRKQIGAITAIAMTIIKGIEIAVSSKTWFMVSLLQIAVAILYGIHVTCVYAYTSELSKEPIEQAKYTTYFYMVMYFATIIYMIIVLSVAYIMDANDVQSARIALTLTFVACMCIFSFVWTHLFTNRPPISRLQDNENNILTSGFKKLYHTSVRINNELPSLRWLMISVAFTESGQFGLISILTRFMSEFLKMDGKEIGVVFMVKLIMGSVGSKVGQILAIHLNPLISATICSVAFITNTMIAVYVVNTPERKNFMLLFAVFWGLCQGWQHPMHTTTFITLRPSGQDAELMSMYLFCCQVISWFPPLVFTLMNEHNVHISYGLASINLFLIVGLIFLLCVGDYNEALDKVQPVKSTREEVYPMSGSGSDIVGNNGKNHVAFNVTDDNDDNDDNELSGGRKSDPIEVALPPIA